jgi:hypothetical protein
MPAKNQGYGEEKQPHKVVTARHSSMVHRAPCLGQIPKDIRQPLQILQKSNHPWSTTHKLRTIPHNEETGTGTTIQTGRDCRHSDIEELELSIYDRQTPTNRTCYEPNSIAARNSNQKYWKRRHT